ncbi:MAG: deoxyribose-phosphate aldolase [Treponema sp.]|nr:deoxyribose-phosphate aldolase [Treponema sp.]
MTRSEIAKFIDHTNLNPCATKADIKKLCDEAKEHSFASVCVNPSFVSFAYEELKNSPVKVCTVIGFPLGADTLDNKAASAAVAVDEGADEIDMVVNLALVKEGEWDELTEEIRAVVDAANSVDVVTERKVENAIIKVILETCFLSDNEIVQACRCAEKAGADFVKTSTGFAIVKDSDDRLLPNGATVHAVSLMRQTVGNKMQVKASGGIRTFEAAAAMIEAGATRIGTSSGCAIVGS